MVDVRNVMQEFIFEVDDAPNVLNTYGVTIEPKQVTVITIEDRTTVTIRGIVIGFHDHSNTTWRDINYNGKNTNFGPMPEWLRKTLRKAGYNTSKLDRD